MAINKMRVTPDYILSEDKSKQKAFDRHDRKPVIVPGQTNTDNVQSDTNIDPQNYDEYTGLRDIDKNHVEVDKIAMPTRLPENITKVSDEKKPDAPKNYADIFHQTETLKRGLGLRTKEDQDKIDKRNKNRKLVAAIGDGLTALSNVWFANKGAIYDQTGRRTISSVLRDRIDKDKKDYEVYERDRLENYWRMQRKKEEDETAKKRAKYEADKLENEKKKTENYEKEVNRRVKRDEIYSEAQDWKQKYEQGLLDDKEERRRIDEAYKKGIISLRERELLVKQLNAQTARDKVALAAQPTTTVEVDEYGDKKTKTTYKGSAGSSSQDGGSGNRRKSKTRL